MRVLDAIVGNQLYAFRYRMLLNESNERRTF